MTLRTRLTVAFFAISVIPLSAVTLFSYFSSERALRRAAEQQAASMAGELGRRMEWVSNDLGRRMDRMWPMPGREDGQAAAGAAQPAPQRGGTRRPPPPPAVPAPPPPDMAGHLALVLGDAAPMIEFLEFLPGTSRGGIPRLPAPGGPRPRAKADGASTEPSAPLPPAPTPPSPPVVVEMSRVIQKAMEQYGAAGTAGQTDLAAWSQAMQARLREAAAKVPSEADLRQNQDEARAAQNEAARLRAEHDNARREAARSGKSAATGNSTAVEAGAPASAAAANAAGAAPTKALTEMKGAEVNSWVRRDGNEVGRIHARLNMPRIFRTIVPARRDQGEVAFAIDEKGEIHASEPDKAKIERIKAAGAIPAAGGSHSGGDWVVVTRKGPGGMTFGTARPVGDDLKELRAVSLRNFGLGFGLIALVFFGSVPLAAGMTRNLRTLMRGVEAVGRGDLSARVTVRSRDEFGRLAAAFNRMAESVAEHEKLVVQQERLQRELELCRQIQNDMLPRGSLRLGLAEVKGVSIPAREVGGDFFNYFALPGGNIAVLVGDVSGKGVGAALLMANVQATLRARLPLEQDLARLAEELDRQLYESTPPEVYLTMFVGIVNPETRVLRYVNAGHNTQFVLRRASGIAAMPSTGRPLGLLPGGGYEERSTELPADDLLFFYTDGIVETENEAGDEFGMPRLESALMAAASPGSHVEDVLTRVEEAVRLYRGRVEPADDATMMALRIGV